MDEPQNLPNTPSPLDNDEKFETLQRQNNLLFAALLITSFTLTAYLGLQMRRVTMDLTNVQARAQETSEIFKKNVAANEAIFQQLTEFSRTHPDFEKQVFGKYKLETNTPPASVKK